MTREEYDNLTRGLLERYAQWYDPESKPGTLTERQEELAHVIASFVAQHWSNEWHFTRRYPA